MAGSQRDAPGASVDLLRLVPEFRSDEREVVIEALRKLDRRLARFPADEVELELSMKERETPAQRLTLECWIAGWPRFVATSTERPMKRALADVSEDLRRQIDAAVNKRVQRRRSTNL